MDTRDKRQFCLFVLAFALVSSLVPIPAVKVGFWAVAPILLMVLAKQMSATCVEPPIRVDAKAPYSAIMTDGKAASRLYEGRYLTVTGAVKKIGETVYGQPKLSLAASPDAKKALDVSLPYDAREYIDRLVRVGDIVSVLCVWDKDYRTYRGEPRLIGYALASHLAQGSFEWRMATGFALPS